MHQMEDLVLLAHDVTSGYPQKWGDCYTVNATVAGWINCTARTRQAEVWQVTVHLDRKVRDVDSEAKTAEWTAKPSHVVVVLDRPDENDTSTWVWEDFSTVLGGASVEDIEFEGKLGGRVDKHLLEKLNNALCAGV